MTPTKQPSARLVSLLLCMTCLLWSCENRCAEDQSDASDSGGSLAIPDPKPITSPTPSPSHEEALKRLKAMLTDAFLKQLKNVLLQEALNKLKSGEIGVNDVYSRGGYSENILHGLAEQPGSKGLIEVLIDAGATPCPTSAHGENPLHVAAHAGCLGNLIVLLEADLSGINAKSNSGNTPLDDANTKLSNHKNNQEDTATTKNAEAIIELLKKNGAKTAAEIP